MTVATILDIHEQPLLSEFSIEKLNAYVGVSAAFIIEFLENFSLKPLFSYLLTYFVSVNQYVGAWSRQDRTTDHSCHFSENGW